MDIVVIETKLRINIRSVMLKRFNTLKLLLVTVIINSIKALDSIDRSGLFKIISCHGTSEAIAKATVIESNLATRLLITFSSKIKNGVINAS